MIRSWLAKHIFYPAQEALCGRDSMAYWDLLEESQCFNLDQLRELQCTKLQALTRHAALESSFYRRRFDATGIDSRQVCSIDDLREMPLLTKDDIRAHREEIVAESHLEKLIASCTSGSTGSPLIFSVGPRRCRSDVAARLRAHRWFGVEPGDPAIYLWGSRIEIDRQDRLKAIRDWFINEKLLSAFELSDEQLHRYADIFLRMKPHSVYSYASTLWRFARFVREQRGELKGVIGKVAFGTGEQMLPEWRGEIIQALECSVAEEYGCREGGLIAHECPAEAYHISAENIIVEILDEQDRAVPAGHEGRIVITNLEAYAMPFIRYDTGDWGALRPGACGCGRSLPLMHRPTGRSFDFLETNDGTKITGVSLSRDLKEVEGIAHYRVVQDTRDRVRILLVPDFRYSREEGEAMIRRFVQARIGPATQVHLEYCDELPPHPSGKYRYVINAIVD